MIFMYCHFPCICFVLATLSLLTAFAPATIQESHLVIIQKVFIFISSNWHNFAFACMPLHNPWLIVCCFLVAGTITFLLVYPLEAVATTTMPIQMPVDCQILSVPCLPCQHQFAVAVGIINHSCHCHGLQVYCHCYPCGYCCCSK